MEIALFVLIDLACTFGLTALLHSLMAGRPYG